MIEQDIYSYVKSQESTYQSEQVRLGKNWMWNMNDHIQMIFHLKNGIFYTGENDYLRAFKNIMMPLLNTAYWIEDIELKDVVFYIENKADRVLSFLIKKYHDNVYVKEHDLDTLFDEITESDVDYGGVLVQQTNGKRPEVVPLVNIAFADQNDMLGGALGFKHNFSPDALRKMEKIGWGSEKYGANVTVDEIITLAQEGKSANDGTNTNKNHTTSKSVEVYVVFGSLPEDYLKDNGVNDKWYTQLHVIAYYTDKKNKRHGVTLYRNKADENMFMFHTSKKVEGRALGMGEGEALLHPQIWTNFLTIHKMNMLEASSKVLLQTTDPAFKNRNKIQEMDNLEITVTQENTRIDQIPVVGAQNIQVMNNAVGEWMQHAQLTSSAQDPLLGKEPVSGTTFRGQERTVAQGRGYHDRRRGQRAKFIEHIYREIIIPDIVKEITDGTKFLATLSSEELVWVAEQLANKEANKRIKDSMFGEAKGDGKMMSQEEVDEFVRSYKMVFMKKSGKHLLEILKGEFEGIEVSIGINIANKQKDLANLSDKILSVFQYIFQNPQGFQQAMQIPALSRAFQDILEFSGMNQADFQTMLMPTDVPLLPAQTPQGQTPEPMLVGEQSQ